MLKHKAIQYILFFFVLLATISGNAASYAETSALNTGKWVKIKVEDTGIYQISAATLSGWGFSDISKVKIFGYGGAMISEIMGNGYIDDLPQVPVMRSGNRILFYAQSNVSWTETSGKIRYQQQQNPYATAGYYFITDRNDIDVAEMQTTAKAEKASDKVITNTLARIYHEKELTAPGTTGRTLLGEDFRSAGTQSFQFNLPGIVSDTDPVVKVAFAAYHTSGTARALTVTSGKQEVMKVSVSSLSGSNEYDICSTASSIGTVSYPGEKMTLQLSFPTGTAVRLANLDYITVNYLRNLNLADKQIDFRSFTANCRDSVFAVSGINEKTAIWDVTTTYAPLKVDFLADNASAQFRQTENGKREYVAFNTAASFPTPSLVGNVSNQDIHAMTPPTMLIITPAAFRNQAESLAAMHRANDGMAVTVLTDEQIYNEFSSGTPDAMAYRKVAKMWYDRTASADQYSNDRFRYLLLFGRAVFDNRRITSTARNLGYPTLLTWESADITSESSSFNTDDVYGFLEDGSDAGRTSLRKMCIGIGRIPVKSAAEATETVQKISDYISNPDMGNWKTRIMMIADDGDSGIHMRDSNDAIDSLRANGAGNYLIQRLFIDAYKASSSGSGHSFPEARTQMLQNFKNGVLFASYVGHANPTSWTHNGLLRWPDIENEFFYSHPPFVFTGTCEFTRWDSPTVSGGEVLFLNSRGGFIGLLTGSRVTSISGNGDLCRAVGAETFKPLPNGEMPRLGDIVMNAKNNYWYTHSRYSSTLTKNTEHSLKYALIGDPALRLKYPKYDIRLTAVNGESVDGEVKPETMARQEVELEGKVVDADGITMTDYNGTLTTTVYDAEVSITTNGYYEGGTDTDDKCKVTYQDHTNRLFVGSGEVKDGLFKMKFRMPTGIINNYTPALVNLYAQDENKGDAVGKNEDFYIYGFDESPADDTDGPEIRLLALNSTAFKDGDKVNETPFLVASVYDVSGINLSPVDIGHGITATIDGTTVVSGLENYFSQDTDGVSHINYQMGELTEGQHTLTFRVWDVLGNMSEKTIAFSVVNGIKPQLFRVYSTANPAKTKADFYIEHNRPDAVLNVTLSIYDMMGHSVWSTSLTGRSDMYKSMPITWDLTDGSGMRVQRGIYIYRATVSTNGGDEASITQRIAVASE